MISVIIPTYNNLTILRITLPALQISIDASKKQIEKDWEIIATDDGSIDNLSGWISDQYPQIDYHWHDNLGRGINRNYGATKASGEYLVFMDADIELESQSLYELITPLLNGRAEVCFGYIKLVVPPIPRPLDAFLAKKTRKLMERFSQSLDPWESYSALFAIKKVNFVNSGGFSDEFKQYGGEDTDFFVRLSKKGARFLFAGNAVGWHHHSLDLERNLKRTYLSNYSSCQIPGYELQQKRYLSQKYQKTIKDQSIRLITEYNLWSNFRYVHYLIKFLPSDSQIGKYFYHYLFLEYATKGSQDYLKNQS